MSKEINNSLLKGCKTLDALFGHEFDGLSSTELANRLNSTPTIELRNLHSLAQMGWVEQDNYKRWRITPTFAQQVHKINNSISSAARRVEELAKRYADTH